MAQTVALQRGSTSVTDNGVDYANLFTQSSGIATRVVLNGIACYAQGSTDFQLFAMLLVKLSGSSTNILTIGIKSFGGAGVGSFDFSPADGIEGNFSGYAPTSTTPFSNKMSTIFTAGGINRSFGATDLTGGNTQLVGGGTNTGLNSNQATYFSVPRDFWIGPSDVVSVKIYGSNQNRVFTVAYSFTTITES